jgi:hypothetical protein
MCDYLFLLNETITIILLKISDSRMVITTNDVTLNNLDTSACSVLVHGSFERNFWLTWFHFLCHKSPHCNEFQNSKIRVVLYGHLYFILTDLDLTNNLMSDIIRRMSSDFAATCHWQGLSQIQ